MSINLESLKAIDPDERRYRRLFDDLQGNIVKGHSRNFVICLFVRFGEEKRKTRAWLKEFCALNLTSASTQIREARRYRQYKIQGSLFANLYLTAHGYRALGFRREQMPADPRFRRGMVASQAALSDPTKEEWESNFQQETDAMLLLAHDDRQQLIESARAIRDDMQSVLTGSFVEAGNVIRNEADQVVEHFGYADGLSQPLFLKDDIAKAEERGGIDRWNPLTPLSSVLVPDPLGDERSGHGSYLVFRKLEQNVAGFHEKVAALAQMLDSANPDVARAGASVMGRFQDGRPLLVEAKGVAAPMSNNFTYANDKDGAHCPMHAHTRKLNPRDGSGFGKNNNAACRIVRRGIPYGRPTAAVDSRWTNPVLPSGGVGLLFMCFQSDIGKQFEVMQRAMANNQQPTGRDPLVGQGVPAEQLWPASGGEKVRFDFGEHVRMCGGEYFFAPSLSFFEKLSA